MQVARHALGCRPNLLRQRSGAQRPSHGRLQAGATTAAAQGQGEQRRYDSRGGGGGGRGSGGEGGRQQRSGKGNGPGPGKGFAPQKPKPQKPSLVQLEDPNTGRSLDCLLRRHLTLSDGREAGLLTPLDTPINVLGGSKRSEDMDELEDAELEMTIDLIEEELLTKRGLLVQRSAFCYTVRGAVRYNEEDVLQLEDEGDDEPSMAVEILSFADDNDKYLVYAPLDPLVLLATPGPQGTWQAMLGVEQEEEPALAKALDELNSELQESAQEI